MHLPQSMVFNICNKYFITSAWTNCATFSCTNTTTRSAPSSASATSANSCPARSWSASRRSPATPESHSTATPRPSTRPTVDSAYAIQEHLFAQNPLKVKYFDFDLFVFCRSKVSDFTLWPKWLSICTLNHPVKASSNQLISLCLQIFTSCSPGFKIPCALSTLSMIKFIYLINITIWSLNYEIE